MEKGAERGKSPKVRILEGIEGLKRGNTLKLKQSLLSNLVVGEARDADSSLPARKSSKVAGASKAEGRVAKRNMEARKASAFMERWLQAGEKTKESGQEPGKEEIKGDRWVGPGWKERPQDRGKQENNTGKKMKVAGAEGTEAVQESNRDRINRE